ncbi:MAG: VOC family protein [Acidimicrobiales bacterium]|nr:VOC family protein [Acidimicrobiales bacterium]
MRPPATALYRQPWPGGEYRLFQLGFLVDDVLSAAERWSTVFGVGPFHVLPPIEGACTYRGTEAALTVQVAIAQAGPVQIELIQQHCDRPSIYREMHERSGPGFHQICTVTDDYDGARTHLVESGYPPASELVTPGGQRVGYFDTVADFGFFTEVAEAVPGFLEQLAAISATCETWDGTDPVRLLTRSGYRTP